MQPLTSSPMFRSRRSRLLACAVASLLPVATAEARDTPSGDAAQTTATPVAADDFTTIDGIMQTFYAVVSGPAGQPRARERDRRLCIPEVRFVAIVAKDGRSEARVMSHPQFVETYEPELLAKGFFESEVHRTTRRFGGIATC